MDQFIESKKKPGRKPLADQAMTPAERQRRSRLARKSSKNVDTYNGMNISMCLSPDAAQALRMLVHLQFGDLSQKELIERLLIGAYNKLNAVLGDDEKMALAFKTLLNAEINR